jgi:hypothetical protein
MLQDPIRHAENLKSWMTDTQFENQCQVWYGTQGCGQLSRYLGHYLHNKVAPTHITCVFNRNANQHWVVYNIDINENRIYEYDPSSVSVTPKYHAITPWLAKLLGLFKYQSMKYGPLYFGPDDMRLTRPVDLSMTSVSRNTKQEILTAFDFVSARHSVPSIDASTTSSSTVMEKSNDVSLPIQNDSNNCGIISMYYMLCVSFGKSPHPDFGKTIHCTKFRRALAQFFIDAAYVACPLNDPTPWIQPLLFIEESFSQQNETDISKRNYRIRERKKSNQLIPKNSPFKGNNLRVDLYTETEDDPSKASGTKASSNLKNEMDEEASKEEESSSEESNSENDEDEDDRKIAATKIVKKQKPKKSAEGNNQSNLTFNYEQGERLTSKERRNWQATKVITPRDKMNMASTTHCSTKHDNVLAECIHVLSSRLNYPYRSEGTLAYMREQIKNNGALYKEITHSISGKPREQKFSVGAVMIYYRRLEYDDQDAIMITNLATEIDYANTGLASSFLHDLCRLHSDDTHVFAMVMNASEIPDATAGKRSISTPLGSPESFYYKYGFRCDNESNQNFHIDDEFIEQGCFLMKTTVRALKIKPKHILPDNIRTLDIDHNVVHKMRWNPTKKCFEGSNVHFPTVADFMVLERKESRGISRDDFDQCKKDPMCWRRLRPGQRDQNILMSGVFSESDTGLCLIPKLFRALSNESGECLWAATSLLVHSINTIAGIQMMNAHTRDPTTFQWLSLFSAKTSRRKRKHNVSMEDKQSLSTLVQQCSPYQVMRIPSKKTDNNNLEYVLRVDTGYFICIVRNQNGGTGHSVGVHKYSETDGYIYDCRERFVLPFSQSNLNHCCGPLMRCTDIQYMGQIVCKRGKIK